MATFSLVGAPATTDTGRVTAARVGTHFDGVLVAAQAGADWAWTLLYRSVAPSVLGYLRARGAEDPENLLGEVFLQLARGLGRFEGDEDAFRAWVFTIAHHRVVDERRRRTRRPVVAVGRVADDAAISDDDAMTGVLTQEARELLESLTPVQRDVLLLRVFADLPLTEVSRILGRPVSAVKSLQHRALATLRRKLAEDPYPQDPVWR